MRDDTLERASFALREQALLPEEVIEVRANVVPFHRVMRGVMTLADKSVRAGVARQPWALGQNPVGPHGRRDSSPPRGYARDSHDGLRSGECGICLSRKSCTSRLRVLVSGKATSMT